MKELLNQILPVLTTALITILVAIIGYVGKEVVKLMPKVIDYIIAKIGLTKYQKIKLVALDVWNKIEEDGRLGKLASSKFAVFESLMKVKFPSITDTDINLLNKAIAGEINKNKPVIIKELEPIVEVAAPIIKYFNADGVELQPVGTNNATTETIAQ